MGSVPEDLKVNSRLGSRISLTALVGSTALCLVLCVGMAISIVRLGALATSGFSLARNEERGITEAERLRWRGELIVSHGRGYLLTGDPVLLHKLSEAERGFTSDFEMLRRDLRDPEERALLEEVGQLAADYEAGLRALLAQRSPTGEPAVLARFESELVPIRNQFGVALDRLVGRKEGTISGFYERLHTAQSRLSMQLFALLGVLGLAGLVFAWTFARALSRSFDKERAALEVSQKAVTARDDLMAMVAHDLRNPLNAVGLKAALLARTSTPERAQETAQDIKTLVSRMDALIRTMMDVATIEAGRFMVSTAPCAADELVSEALMLFENLAASQQVHLVHHAPERVLVEADRSRILQVLSNLLGNALKFSAPGSTVTLTAQRVETGVRFEVSDQGPGILPSDLPRIFDRYWKREHGGVQGTGLGLFISRNIVAAHGSVLDVKSQPGAGATFCFVLPFAAAHPPA